MRLQVMRIAPEEPGGHRLEAHYAGTSKRIPPFETAFTESSESKTTFRPSRAG